MPKLKFIIYHLSLIIDFPLRNFQIKKLKNKWKMENGKWKMRPAFTLIELLIVISIIAILVASATYSWQNAQQKGRDGKRKSDLKAVQQALEFYYQNNGKYPDSSSGQIKCNISGDTNNKNWGTPFNCGTINYMQQLPKDPIATQSYYFTSSGSPPNSYALFAIIENTKDPDLTNLPSCTMPSPSYNYCTVNP